MNRAACTIVSVNYLHYARLLCNSFHNCHPGLPFFVLLVDRLPAGMDVSNEPYELVCVEDLDIPNFRSIAFKYDVLELNTNVKATFLRSLLNRGLDQVVYLDPDIFIYQSLEPIFDALEKHSIVLTPHALSPHPGDHGRSELSHLKNGIYNLGFIAVRQDSETRRFLSWWEDRCWNFAYATPQSYMFVDQKWIDLAACFFDSIGLLKHQGCNVAYWNLYERFVTHVDGRMTVNNSDPLVFFHFSGIRIDGNDRISKHFDSFDLASRPDLKPLFEAYRGKLKEQTVPLAAAHRYVFGVFDNGYPITPFVRRLYAANIERFQNQDPFSSSSAFFAWARTKGAIVAKIASGTSPSTAGAQNDNRFMFANRLFRLALRLLGPERYMLLLKYLSYVIVLENQKIVIGD
jgi:Nucleotide-diphospho-sugar transferase